MLKNHAKIEFEKGFTLIELMVTLSVLAILATLAIPSMTEFFDKRRVINAAEDLYGNVQLARAEALARFKTVYIHFSGSAPGATWQYGISTNAACNLAKTDPTEASANACVLVVDNGNGTVDDGTATIDSADLALHRITNSDYKDVSINSVSDTEITFDPQRGTAEIATITLQSAGGYAMRIKTNALGQVHICSPADGGGLKHIPGYSSDDCA